MVHPIRTESQYAKALGRANKLMQKKLRAGSDASDELEVLSMLIESYESKHYPIAPPNPIDAIKFRLDQLGLELSELRPILGYRSRVSEVMNGKRKLTLEMIRNLHTALNIPLESLVGRY